MAVIINLRYFYKPKSCSKCPFFESGTHICRAFGFEPAGYRHDNCFPRPVDMIGYVVMIEDYIRSDCPLVNYDEKPAGYKTVKEFADEWGVKPSTIRAWIKRKKLQALKIGSCNYILEGTPKPGRKQRKRKE